jgi:hypothetical protein
MAVNEYTNTMVKTFEQNVTHLVQQGTSKLRRTVTEKNPGPTEKHSFRIVDPRGAMTERTNIGTVAGKRPATPYADTVYNDRACFNKHYGTADSFSKAEVLRSIVDPQSAMTQAMAKQIGRQFDDVIIAALFANAPDSAGNANAHPAASQLGGAAIPPSFDLVKSVKEVILENDVDPDETFYFVVSPNFVTTLLSDVKVSSFDYASGKALMSAGIVEGWMGFTWIISNRLTKAVVGPPAQIYGAAYSKDAIGLLTLQDVAIKIGEDPGQYFDTTVLAEIDIGAVRIQDKKCFRVHYLEGN